MKIGNFDLNRNILLVAEIGNNHEGDFDCAKRLIREAAKAGADAVKFQTIVPERLVAPQEKERRKQLEKFCLRYDQFEQLSKVAHEENVLFLSTPFDIPSVHFLKPYVPAYKIASGDNDFFPLIKAIAQTGKPILLSSGLSTLEQIRKTKEFIETVWQQDKIQQEIAILHCVVSYPTEPKHANLLAIRELSGLGVTVGYSDHTLGIEAAVLSVALGARVIEKHFTLSKTYSDFHDHKISADPNDFLELSRRVRNANELLGDGVKQIQEPELKNMGKVRRTIVAAQDLKEGAIIRWDNLSWLRPSAGLRPGEEEKVVGKKLKRALAAGDPILPQDLVAL